MHRAGKQSVAALAFAATLALPARALAFHAGDVFDKPPGAGGGGGVFYAGVPGEKGWNCTACHTDAPGTIRVDLSSSPRTLFDGRAYAPGQAYALTANLVGEHEGLGSPLANFNSIAVSVVDADGKPAGSITGYAAEDFYASGSATIVSAGQQIGTTSWSFTWHAPSAPAGPVTIHVAAVDGNGANSGPTGTLTDPWGDDVFVGALTLAGPEGTSTSDMGFGSVLGALFAWGRVRRIRRGRRSLS